MGYKLAIILTISADNTNISVRFRQLFWSCCKHHFHAKFIIKKTLPYSETNVTCVFFFMNSLEFGHAWVCNLAFDFSNFIALFAEVGFSQSGITFRTRLSQNNFWAIKRRRDISGDYFPRKLIKLAVRS